VIEPGLFAHGFAAAVLVDLVAAGLATIKPDGPVVYGGRREPKVMRLRITDEGRQALGKMKAKHTAGRYEIAVDGQPRFYRSDEVTAREGAIFLKTQNPDAVVTVRDLATARWQRMRRDLI
jgi:hypothetical protein